MKVGDVITTSSITAQIGWPKTTFSAGFKSPPKTRFVFLLLGTESGQEPADPEKMLNDLGWYRKEKNNGNKEETQNPIS